MKTKIILENQFDAPVKKNEKCGVIQISDGNNIIKEIDLITKTTEKEVYLESVIADLDYEDALVFLEDGVLNISVLAESFSKLEYVEVAKIAKEEFGKDVLVVVELVKSGS